MPAYKKTVLLKVLLIGPPNVGKTSIFHRFVKNEYSNTYKPTLGADFFSKQINIESTEVIMQIWDTAGQERYQSLGSGFYRGSDVCILVYDITNKQSFDELDNYVEQFLQKVDSHSEKPENDFLFIVLGNKCDLDNREVDSEVAPKFCEERGFNFFEVSALTGYQVPEAFQFIALKGLEKLELQLSDFPIESITLDDDGEDSVNDEAYCAC